MKCSFDISDFLEEISSLSHSVVFLYFFALIAEEGFLISSCLPTTNIAPVKVTSDLEAAIQQEPFNIIFGDLSGG